MKQGRINLNAVCTFIAKPGTGGALDPCTPLMLLLSRDTHTVQTSVNEADKIFKKKYFNQELGVTKNSKHQKIRNARIAFVPDQVPHEAS